MQLIAALLDLCSKQQYPVIAIDGPAGAGKTTLAHEIFLALSLSQNVNVIHMDDLYNGWQNALTEDLSKILKYLIDSHRQQSPAQIRKYNWLSNEFEEIEVIPVANILVLEGVGSAPHQIQDEISALIWLEIDPEIGLSRVIARDGEGVAPEMKKWLSTQQQFFRQHSPREKADFILTT
jgi:uridine kinase